MAGDLVLAAAWRASSFLRERGVDFVFVGGLALQPWGRVRSTLDVDLLVVVPEPRQAGFLAELKAAGFSLRLPEPVRLGDVVLVPTLVAEADRLVDIRVDFLMSASPFHRRTIERRVILSINGHDLPVASCEDLILLKLLAGRPIDRLDAAELGALNASTLDCEYLRREAAALGLSAELDNCLRPNG